MSDSVFQAAGQRYNVDPALLQAIAGAESGGNPNAVSPAGAIGLMQLMPATAQGLGVDPRDPVASVYGAAQLMRQNLDQFGNVPDALRAYNAGPNQSHWGNPETQGYVGRVASFYKPSAPVAQVPPGSGQPPPNQVASANTGTMSDANPSPDAQALASVSPAPTGGDAFSQAFGAAMPAHAAAAPATANDNDAFSQTFGPALAAAKTTATSAAQKPGLLASVGNSIVRGAQDGLDVVNRADSWLDQHDPAANAVDHLFYTNPQANVASETAARTAYDAQPHSITEQIGRVVGNVAASAPIGGVAASAIKYGGALAADAVGAGTTAGRVIQAGTNLLSGSGATSLPGRIVTAATSNAAQGATGAAVTGNDPVTGAILGSVGGLAGHALLPLAKGAILLGTKAGNAALDALGARAAADVAPAASDAAPMGGALNPQSAAPSAQQGPVTLDRLVQAVRNADDPVPGVTEVPPSPQPAPGGSLNPENATPAAAPSGGTAPGGALNPQNVPTSIKPPSGVVLTKAQAGERADGIIREFAEGGNTDLAPMLPGGAFDAAEATGNPGIQALKTWMQSASPGSNNQFGAIRTVNGQARLQVLAGITKDPADLAAMEAARDAETSGMRDAAFANAQPVDPSPLLGQIDDAIKARRGNQAVVSALQSARNDIMTAVDTGEDGAMTVTPQNLYNARQNIGYSLSSAAKGTTADKSAAASELAPLMQTFTDTIDGGAPGFAAYMKRYSDLSRPIDGTRWLQQQGISITDGQGNITLAKLDSTIKALDRKQGANGISDADSVTPEQRQALVDLRQNLRQASAATYAGKPLGSNTAQNLGTNALMGKLAGGRGDGVKIAGALGGEELGGLSGGLTGVALGGLLSATRHGVGRLNARANDMVMQAIQERLTNPELFRNALNR